MGARTGDCGLLLGARGSRSSACTWGKYRRFVGVCGLRRTRMAGTTLAPAQDPWVEVSRIRALGEDSLRRSHRACGTLVAARQRPGIPRAQTGARYGRRRFGHVREPRTGANDRNGLSARRRLVGLAPEAAARGESLDGCRGELLGLRVCRPRAQQPASLAFRPDPRAPHCASGRHRSGFPERLICSPRLEGRRSATYFLYPTA